ncbi:Nuclear pore localization protein NPL4 [Nannochloropsis gaditana]|uniref:Nuclear pore localization protein NPL4 n=1 Tax=Nannochloropsis gaditana TaxID=72520 RepID=W7TV78_9STRA|nr:Nuclear pore localization protein NPL4 [Nannochloropsis gaditana]
MMIHVNITPQIESMKASVSSSPPSLGSAFLTLAVNTSAAFDTQHPVEAFQVSPQGVQMVWDGLIQDGGAGALLSTTSDVFVSGKTRREVDAALFTLPLAITPDSTPSSLPPSIASSIVRNALPALKDDEDLRAALLGRERGNRWLETRDKKLLSKLADFHLLIYLSKYLRSDDLAKLSSAIVSLGEKKKRTKEKKGVASPTVPPAVRALLEALCDEA